MDFVDTEETRILYLSARPRRGCDRSVAKTFGAMTNVCREMYEKRREFTVRYGREPRKKLTMFFLFETKEDRVAFEKSKGYQDLLVDLRYFCKRNKLFKGAQVRMTPVQPTPAEAKAGLKIRSIEEVPWER
jgi:hypothetical protein